MIKHYQYYGGIKLGLIVRDYQGKKAKRFTLGDTNQNVWIPNKHLDDEGYIKEGENIIYIFRDKNKLESAGYDYLETMKDLYRHLSEERNVIEGTKKEEVTMHTYEGKGVNFIYNSDFEGEVIVQKKDSTDAMKADMQDLKDFIAFMIKQKTLEEVEKMNTEDFLSVRR